MNIEVKSKELKNAVKKVSKGISKSKTLPVLKHILLEATDYELQVTFTDLDVRITASIDADIKQIGKTLVDGKIFEKIVSFIDSEKINISTNDKKETVISADETEFTLCGLSVENYPPKVELQPLRCLKLPGNIIASMLERCVRSVSLNDSRKVLHGILFEIKDNFLQIVGCDGKRLAYSGVRLENFTGTDVNSIIPVISAKKIIEIFKRDAEPVTIKLGEKFASFANPETALITKVIEGNYPHYRHVIPDSFIKTIELDRIQLIKKINTVTKLFSISSNYLHLDFKFNKLAISMESYGNKSKDSMLGIINNELGINVSTCFYHKYILDILKSCPDESVTFNINSGTEPISISGKDFNYIIMPMRTTKS